MIAGQKKKLKYPSLTITQNNNNGNTILIFKTFMT